MTAILKIWATQETSSPGGEEGYVRDWIGQCVIRGGQQCSFWLG